MIISFGEHLRSMREIKQLSLREVAAKIGIDTSLLGKIERDKRKPTREQIKLVAKFFKFDETILYNEHLSDQIAYMIIEEDADSEIFKIAEKKIEYLKTKKK